MLNSTAAQKQAQERTTDSRSSLDPAPALGDMLGSGRARVDHALFVATLSARLRADGIAVSISSAERLACALALCTPIDVARLYWVTRTCVVKDRSEIPAFDAAFRSIFARGDPPPSSDQLDSLHGLAPRAAGTVLTTSVAPGTSPPSRFTGTNGRFIVDERHEAALHADEAGLPHLLPSARSEMADTPFDQLSTEQLAQLRQWLDNHFDEFSARRSRRRRPVNRSAAIDLRRTMMAARSTGGEPIRLAYREQRLRQRRIVMIADLSGSMRVYSRVYLLLARALVLRMNAEAFTISTSLRRVTTQLRHSDTSVAVDRLTDQVVDRFGGTRIAASLRELLTSSVWSNTVRGAVVVIASDGWDADSPELLGEAMQRLSRMAHKVIWVNPRAGAGDFEPLVSGMAAALPYADTMLSGHTLNAMRDVIESLAST